MKNVIIKPADKGRNVVLWPLGMSEKEVFRQLLDLKIYKKLTYHPLSSFQGQLTEMINKAYTEGMIDKNTKDCLIPDSPKIACFYLLPKLHKNLQTPPDRIWQ